jgi:hypothetical protein
VIARASEARAGNARWLLRIGTGRAPTRYSTVTRAITGVDDSNLGVFAAARRRMIQRWASVGGVDAIMEPSMADSGERQLRFAEVVDALRRQPDVSHGLAGSQKTFGHSALKVDGRIFAMVSSAGHFVVKLPKLRVDALVTGGAGKRFEASRARPMKEWLQVHSDDAAEWLQLAREALEFVRNVP